MMVDVGLGLALTELYYYGAAGIQASPIATSQWHILPAIAAYEDTSMARPLSESFRRGFRGAPAVSRSAQLL